MDGKENREAIAMGICACVCKAICMGAPSGTALANVVVTCGTMSASPVPTASPEAAAAGLLPEAPPQADNKALSIAKLSTTPHARQPRRCGMGGNAPLRSEKINLDMRDLHSKNQTLKEQPFSGFNLGRSPNVDRCTAHENSVAVTL
jgi:hypothetical protein